MNALKWLAVMVLPVAAQATAGSLLPVEAGSTACSCVAWWQTEKLRVGQPNILNRRDRTTMRFDLSPYLLAGRVSKAELRLKLKHYGIKDLEDFVVDRLKDERESIRAVDTLSEDAETVGRFSIATGEASPVLRSIDVTDAVNGMLSSGHVHFVVRVRDATAEKRGNPERKPRGAEIAKDGLCLEVEP